MPLMIQPLRLQTFIDDIDEKTAPLLCYDDENPYLFYAARNMGHHGSKR